MAEVPVKLTPQNNWRKIGLSVVVALFLATAVVLSSCVFRKEKQGEGPQPTPTLPVISSTPTPDPTANWKIYTNTKYGYSIKYSNNFFVKKWTPATYILDSTSFFLVKYQDQQLPQQPEIGIGVYSDEELSFGEWWREHSTDKPFGSIEDSAVYYFGVRNIGQAQDGLEWWIFSDESYGIQTNHQMIARNGKIYDLHCTNLLGEDLKPIFNLMLSTFRFLE